MCCICCTVCVCVLSGFSSGRRAPPPPTPTRVPAKVPPAAAAHPPSAVGAAQPRQPGLFGQMAATAVGVGVGSVVVSCTLLKFLSPLIVPTFGAS